jgi:hypothetical protein
MSFFFCANHPPDDRQTETVQLLSTKTKCVIKILFIITKQQQNTTRQQQRQETQKSQTTKTNVSFTLGINPLGVGCCWEKTLPFFGFYVCFTVALVYYTCLIKTYDNAKTLVLLVSSRFLR